MAAKELQAILEAHALARQRGEPSALVTVVKTSGSTYRRPGARMFVDASGRSAGSISGGCLEEDARQRALEVIASTQPAAVRYDTTADGDIVWGSGLGCNGVVHVLIEPLLGGPGFPKTGDGLEPASPLTCAAQALRQRRTGALASVFAVEDAFSDAQSSVGEFLWLSAENDALSPLPVTNIADPALAGAVLADARAVLREARSRVRAYPLADSVRAEVFIDFIAPPRSLLVFGGGHDAAPLVRLAKELGWRVRLVDHRRANAMPERFPEADEVMHCPPRAVGERLLIEPGEAAVIMTHNYLHDLDILRALLASPASYIGVLGPKRRKERLLSDLASGGSVVLAPHLKPASLRRVCGPAGLDIGAETPEQIALSILAEIEAVSARRRGGPLKRRRGPLHETAAEAAGESGAVATSMSAVERR